jgi:hypothetical protein
MNPISCPTCFLAKGAAVPRPGQAVGKAQQPRVRANAVPPPDPPMPRLNNPAVERMYGGADRVPAIQKDFKQPHTEAGRPVQEGSPGEDTLWEPPVHRSVSESMPSHPEAKK